MAQIAHRPQTGSDIVTRRERTSHKLDHLVGLMSPATLAYLEQLIEDAGDAPEKIFVGVAEEAPKRETVILQGAPVTEPLSDAEAKRRLVPLTLAEPAHTWAKSELIGSGELAKRLSVSESTITNWRKDKKVVAIQKGMRNYIFPLRQFSGSKPVNGLAEVLAIFDAPESAWFWLVGINPQTSHEEPIDRLHKGEVEEVVNAAKGAWGFQ